MPELFNIFICDTCDKAAFTKRGTKKCCKQTMELMGWYEQKPPAQAPVGK